MGIKQGKLQAQNKGNETPILCGLTSKIPSLLKLSLIKTILVKG